VPERTLRVLSLYPELMNIYADRGNMVLLERRCAWREIGFELQGATLGDPVDPDAADLYYIGGGQDREALHQAAARGAVILAVCGGYQLLGHSYQLGAETLPGTGLLDLHTVRADDGADGKRAARLIGNVAIQVELERRSEPQVLAGFENHGGRTHLGAATKPLGKVLRGFGNNGEDGFEGARSGNVIGTYLHGPLLPKNVWFADWLIEAALGLEQPLEPLDDELEQLAHAAARTAAGI
jgi:lipid II isoglutaminyl synthase (glutamine-hydrolysing)